MNKQADLQLLRGGRGLLEHRRGRLLPNGNWAPWFYQGEFDAGVDDRGYRDLFVR